MCRRVKWVGIYSNFFQYESMFNISDELVSVMVLSEKENDASESKKPKSLPFGGSQTNI